MAKNEKKIIKQAWQETKNLKEGEVFLLKDLFKGYKWNRIKMETRSSLGRLFLEKVQNKKSVEAIEKNIFTSAAVQKAGIILPVLYNVNTYFTRSDMAPS